MRCLPGAGSNGDQKLDRHVWARGAHECKCGAKVRSSLVRRMPGTTDEVAYLVAEDPDPGA